MLAWSHALTGLGTYGAVAHSQGWVMGAAPVAAALAGSLAPDVDHPRATIHRFLGPASGLFSVLFRHRGATHSLMICALLVAPLWFLDPAHANHAVWFAFVVGYIGHLMGDFVTRGGLPLLWPVRKRFRTPFAVRTGGTGEYVIVGVYMGLIVIVISDTTPAWSVWTATISDYATGAFERARDWVMGRIG